MPRKSKRGRRSTAPGRTRKLRRAERTPPRASRAPMTEATEAVGGREPAGEPTPSPPQARRIFRQHMPAPGGGTRLYRPPGPDVAYVTRELRRIGLLSGGMFAVLALAYVFLR